MEVLVTGGAGFIGSHVVDRLEAAGHSPRIYDLRPSPHHARDAVRTVLGDLCDLRALTDAMCGCDAVIHLAAAADVNEVQAEPVEAERRNARGTLHVLEAARRAGVGRVVYASTIWVYSDTDAELLEESVPLHPPAHLYTATKLAGELYCRSYRELYGVESTILRFGIPYGPRARPAAVIPAFVRKALAGEPLTVAGDGLQSRRFVYVEDLADGVVRALAPVAADRVYNLVGSEDVTVAAIAETVRELLGDVEVVRVPGRTGDFGGAPVSGNRAARDLGWRPTTPFREGVRRYIEWHRDGDAPAPAVAAPERWPAVALTFLRRAALAIAMAAFVGVLVIGVATLMPVDQDMDVYDTFGSAVLLLAPLVLAGAFHWEHPRRRWLRAALWTLAIGNLALLLAPWPGAIDHLGHAHHAFLALSAVSAGCAALMAGGRSPRTWLPVAGD